MSQGPTHLSLLHGHPALQQRLRDVGLPLIVCTETGAMLNGPPRGEDWLGDLLYQNPLLQGHVARAVRRWNNEDDPRPFEPVPGLQLVPIPLVARRRRTGFSIVVLITTALLESEHLNLLCQSAKLDFELTKRLIAQMPPVEPADAERLRTLIRFMHDDHARLLSDEQAIESTGQQLAESYEEISLLYTIIQSMTVVQQPDRFVKIACEELHGTLPYAWIGTLLADNPERLKKLAGRFFLVGQPPSSSECLRPLVEELLAKCRSDAPIVLEPDHNPEHERYQPLGETALIHPVSSDGNVLGLLIAGRKQGHDTAASSVDMKLLGATASHMSIFLENAALYDDLNAMFLGTLEALTASIDAKDRYTCGHSQRVAHLTQQIARAIGLDEQTVRRMHIAGLVHDVGKIGVPEAVLLKPGKLTDEEFAWIRKHPEMGYRILRDIPQFKDILPGVLYHHERWDGRGYPAGLAGDEIPRVARLIGLADSFDAMSSTRTYRAAMNREQVLEEVQRCAGTQFDPELVPHFLKLDFSQYDRLVEEHKAGESGSLKDALLVRGAAA